MKKNMMCVVLLLMMTGCVSSVNITPAVVQTPSFGYAPLDLSVSLGQVSAFVNGKPLHISERDLDYADIKLQNIIARTGLVRVAMPRGNKTDLYIDGIYYIVSSVPETVMGSLWRFIITAAATVLPVPYTYELEITNSFKLRTEYAGKNYIIREATIQFHNTVTTRSLWGPIVGSEKIADAMHTYLVDVLKERLKQNYTYYEAYIHARDTGTLEDYLSQFIAFESK